MQAKYSVVRIVSINHIIIRIYNMVMAVSINLQKVAGTQSMSMLVPCDKPLYLISFNATKIAVSIPLTVDHIVRLRPRRSDRSAAPSGFCWRVSRSQMYRIIFLKSDTPVTRG